MKLAAIKTFGFKNLSMLDQLQ